MIPQYSLDDTGKVKKLKFDVFVVGDDGYGNMTVWRSREYRWCIKGTSSSSLKQQIAARSEEKDRKSSADECR